MRVCVCLLFPFTLRCIYAVVGRAMSYVVRAQAQIHRQTRQSRHTHTYSLYIFSFLPATCCCRTIARKKKREKNSSYPCEWHTHTNIRTQTHLYMLITVNVHCVQTRVQGKQQPIRFPSYSSRCCRYCTLQRFK